jgi:excisionase family DNA binding protein
MLMAGGSLMPIALRTAMPPGSHPSLIEPDLIDIAEVRRLLGFQSSSIYKLVRTGRLAAYRIAGRAIRFHRPDVLALIERRPAAGSGEPE